MSKHRLQRDSKVAVTGRAGRRWCAWFVLSAVLALALVLGSASGLPAGTRNATSPAPVRGGRPGKVPAKVLLVVIDRIGIDDLTARNAPNILELMARGSTSLMNARVKYDLYGTGSYVVIGAGGRAIGGPNSGLSFGSSERLTTGTGRSVPAGEVYESRTGRRASPGQVLNLQIEEMRKKSDTTLATAVPGVLGQVLRKGGRRVAVLGSSDSLIPSSLLNIPTADADRRPLSEPPGERSPGGAGAPGEPSFPLTSFLHREAACIAMDENGVVPVGDVSGELLASYSEREGLVTDYRALEKAAKVLLGSNDVVVVDTGQTSRVDEQADFFTEEALASARAAALRRSDAWLGRMAGALDPRRDLLIVCTPTPTRKMIKDKELLTPLVIAGPGFDGGGRIRSATTRRAGLVSNFDIAPTVIAASGLEVPGYMDGRVLTAAGTSPDVAGLKEFRDRAVSASSSRKLMVRVYVITSMCLIGLFFLFVLLRPDMVDGHPFFWSTVLLSVLAGPFVWLAIPVLGAVPPWAQVTAAVCGSAGLALLSLLLRSREFDPDNAPMSEALLEPILAISGLTTLLILLDVVLGSPLMTFSTFGSDVILADRYYGLGNLYFGFLLGAAVLFACLAIQTRGSGAMGRLRLDSPWKRYAFAAVTLGTVTFVAGFSGFGADFGGLLAALAAGLVAVVHLEGASFTPRKAIAVLLVLVLCVGGLLLLDALTPESGSHAGRAIEKAHASGLSSLFSQVGRKLGANWTLTFASLWRLLLLFGAVAWLVFNRRFHILVFLRENLKYLAAGFWALVVGLAVGWLFNDSGIETASALSVFLFVPHFVMLVHWRNRRVLPPEDR